MRLSCDAIADADRAAGAAPCLTASDDCGLMIDGAEVTYREKCPECLAAASG